jgi:hypothetical protein
MNTDILNPTIFAYNRKCSFCGCQGHNITVCNSDNIITANNYLLYVKNHFTAQHNSNRILALRDFENCLYNYCSQTHNHAKLIKAIACRFYNTRLRSSVIIAINKIILSLFEIDINWISFHEHNYVPFNENTPVRISYVLNGIIINYMVEIQRNSNNGNNVNNPPNIFDSNIIFTKYEFKLETLDDEKQCQYNKREIECSICYNSVEKINCAAFECKHEYCIDCTKQLVIKKHTSCPYCRYEIKNITCYNEESYNKLSNLNSHANDLASTNSA